MIILLVFAFVSGLITILAPCIWPLLPLILSTTATGGHRKPLGVVLGIMFSFGILTLSLGYVVKIFPFDPNVLRLISVFVIAFLGLTLLIPKLSRTIEGAVSRLSGGLTQRFMGKDANGFVGGLLTGMVLGIVWTPCAGPILATIATLAATNSVNAGIVIVTTVYLIGVGIPLFLFALFGRFIFTKSRALSKYTGIIQQVFGIILLLTALLIFTNYDKRLQAGLLDLFPSYGEVLTNFENNNAVKEQLDVLKGGTNPLSETGNSDSSNLFNVNSPAPEFEGVNKWLNIPAGSQGVGTPLTLNELKGKVVLVDFWTYTCINCIRTLPHVTSWYEKYKDQGFVVIGVHTPEFEFEKNTENVLNAIKQYNINYPVAQDNDFATWNAYNNQYWPAKYLIDKDGKVRYTHFGEGEYEITEKAIQELLKESGKSVSWELEKMPDQTPKTRNTPETYLGSKRMEYLYPNGQVGNGAQNFKTSSIKLPLNTFNFGGSWNITDETAVTKDKSVINYNFSADKVYLVLRPGSNQNASVKVFLDGKLVTDLNAGADVENGIVIIDKDRLYSLIDLKGKPGNHILKLEFQNSGIEAFAFTFG